MKNERRSRQKGRTHLRRENLQAKTGDGTSAVGRFAKGDHRHGATTVHAPGQAAKSDRELGAKAGQIGSPERQGKLASPGKKEKETEAHLYFTRF